MYGHGVCSAPISAGPHTQALPSYSVALLAAAPVALLVSHTQTLDASYFYILANDLLGL